MLIISEQLCQFNYLYSQIIIEIWNFNMATPNIIFFIKLNKVLYQYDVFEECIKFYTIKHTVHEGNFQEVSGNFHHNLI